MGQRLLYSLLSTYLPTYLPKFYLYFLKLSLISMNYFKLNTFQKFFKAIYY